MIFMPFESQCATSTSAQYIETYALSRTV